MGELDSDLCTLKPETVRDRILTNEDGAQGFGGAITESSAYVWAQMDEENRRELIDAYFDDLYTVEDYSLKHNIPVKVIWIVIHRANRTVMETLGILDKKKEGET